LHAYTAVLVLYIEVLFLLKAMRAAHPRSHFI